MIGFLHLFSLVLGAFAVALLGPAALGASLGETAEANWFLIVAGLSGFLAGSIFFAFQGRQRQVGRAGSFIFAAALWVLPALLGAVPFVGIAGLDPAAAFFESVSAYTTTGATALDQLDRLSISIIFWRAELQWLGGLTTLVVVTIVLAPTGAGGLPSRHIALVDPTGSGDSSRLFAMVGQVAQAYALVTLACFVALLLARAPAFDAFCLALSTVSTGGMMPREGTLEIYRPATQLVLLPFMVIGATSILWHRMLFNRRPQLLAEHRESYWLIGMALAFGLVYAVMLLDVAGPEMGQVGALRAGLVTGVSLVTTTGYQGADGAFTVLPLALVLPLVMIGGGTFSTAGGLKYYRLGALLAQSRREISRLIHPHAVRSRRFGSHVYDDDMAKGIWSHLVASALAIAAVVALLGLEGLTADQGLVAAMSAFSNIGQVYAAGWGGEGGWPTYGEMSGPAQTTLALAMIAGRMEIIALLAAVHVAYWRS